MFGLRPRTSFIVCLAVLAITGSMLLSGVAQSTGPQPQTEPSQPKPVATPKQSKEPKSLSGSIQELAEELSRGLASEMARELPFLASEMSEMARELSQELEFSEPLWRESFEFEFDSFDWSDFDELFDAHEWEMDWETDFEEAQWEMEWRIEDLCQDLEERFDSPEWKSRILELEHNAEEMAREIEQRFNSAEWQERLQEIERRSEELGDRIADRVRNRKRDNR